MKLNVPVLSQRDPRWASQRLGTVDGTTIGGYGCIVTCMTMLANYYGHDLTPADMDNWLTDNQGYVQGNLYRNDAFDREFPDCSFDSVTFCTATPAPLSQIDNYLAQGKPVVIMVDFDHDPTDGIQTHFVLIVGKDVAGNYFINDPWYGDQVYLIARYGENQAQVINQINFFSGPIAVVTPPTPVPPVEIPPTPPSSTPPSVPPTTNPIIPPSTPPSTVPEPPSTPQNPPVEPNPVPSTPPQTAPEKPVGLFQKLIELIKRILFG